MSNISDALLLVGSYMVAVLDRDATTVLIRKFFPDRETCRKFMDNQAKAGNYTVMFDLDYYEDREPD